MFLYCRPAVLPLSFKTLRLENNLLEEEPVKLVPANIFKRLANYLFDILVFSFALGFVLSIVASYHPALRARIIAQQPFSFIEQFSIFFIYGLFLSVCEAAFKGKSPGKFLTRTRAVYLTGKQINSQTAFLRGLIRIVPFEAFSAIITRPWHDRWSSTVVVDEDRSILPKNQ